MINYKLIINPFAEEDLVSSNNWYEEQKEGLGKEFILEIKKTIIKIQQNPEQFPIYK